MRASFVLNGWGWRQLQALTLFLNSLIAWGGAATSLIGFTGLAFAISGGLVYKQAPLRSTTP